MMLSNEEKQEMKDCSLEIENIISNSDITVIYAWTEWCQGGKNTYENYMQPFIDTLNSDICVVLLYAGNIDTTISINKENVNIFYLKSNGGTDKLKFNKIFNTVFRDYKKLDYVPISILCDREGNILNYNESSKDYSSFGEIVYWLNGEW